MHRPGDGARPKGRAAIPRCIDARSRSRSERGMLGGFDAQLDGSIVIGMSTKIKTAFVR
jgi:hypothetical protein